jgi:predicted ATP-grasp superfamily ATP-dependent carboligase
MASTSTLPSAILVHEYVTGGGWPEPDLPGALGDEAAALVQALLADLRAWGRFPVVTTHDPRWRREPLAVDRVVDLSSEVYPTGLLRLARECGAAIVVAPEGDGVLERLSSLMLGAGVCLLGSLPWAVAVAADKYECHRRFTQAGLPTPDTVRVAPAAAAMAADRLGYPVVVKPLDGAGCDGVCLAGDESQLEAALRQPALIGRAMVLVQRYVEGRAVSVSLVATAGRTAVLSLNAQSVHAGIPFVYHGGVAGIPHPRRAEVCELAQRAAALVPGLRGYVGVDMVLGEQEIWMIEINPRPTTSYVGLRHAIDVNIAAAIWHACRDGSLPAVVHVASPSPHGERGGSDGL